jgi:copper chaperone CopZ
MDVVSAVPGRVRLRSNHRPPAADHIAAVGRAFEAVEGVTAVTIRPSSSSVLVTFDPQDAHVATELSSLLGPAGTESSVSRPIDLDVRITSAIGTVNHAVARSTGGIDLRQLLPFGLGLLSLRQALAGRGRLTEAPWYLLAWYASETFLKLHDRPSEDPQSRT